MVSYHDQFYENSNTHFNSDELDDDVSVKNESIASNYDDNNDPNLIRLVNINQM